MLHAISLGLGLGSLVRCKWPGICIWGAFFVCWLSRLRTCPALPSFRVEAWCIRMKQDSSSVRLHIGRCIDVTFLEP